MTSRERAGLRVFAEAEAARLWKLPQDAALLAGGRQRAGRSYPPVFRPELRVLHEPGKADDDATTSQS